MFSCKSRSISFSAMLALLLASCVSQLKYDRVIQEVDNLRVNRENDLKRAESLKVQLEKTSKELADLKDENDALKRDSAQSGAMYRRNKALLDDVFDKYDRLNKSYNTLLANSSTEQKETDQELADKEKNMLQLRKDLEETKAQIKKAQAELEEKKRETENLSQKVGQKEEKIREMQVLIESREKVLADFRTRMDAAVKELNNSELMVSQKEGRVYVQIPNGSLFGTGESSLQESGREALRKVAQVLNQNEEFDVVVEGHTDISPYRPSSPVPPAAKAKPVAKGKGKAPVPAKLPQPKAPLIKDNWDLSAIRAATVARELYVLGISGDRISATGKGEFYPLDKSGSEEARRRNRRVEIVISPRIQSVLQIFGKPGKN